MIDTGVALAIAANVVAGRESEDAARGALAAIGEIVRQAVPDDPQVQAVLAGDVPSQDAVPEPVA